MHIAHHLSSQSFKLSHAVMKNYKLSCRSFDPTLKMTLC